MPTRKCRKNLVFCGVSFAELTESRSYQPQKLQIDTKRVCRFFAALVRWDSPLALSPDGQGEGSGRAGRGGEGRGKAREGGFNRSNIK
jgi:hypothetical protein